MDSKAIDEAAENLKMYFTLACQIMERRAAEGQASQEVAVRNEMRQKEADSIGDTSRSQT
jgi:hypothetical protein